MICHLHWAYKDGPHMLRGLTTGIALCGARDVLRKDLTSFVEDADCEQCLQRAKNGHKERGPRPQLTTQAKWS